ncbi:MAG: hypothetical protein HY403_10550 [Elusimicrobia bacterium]|nr:hypothetical protein [Elusimicrobiota bacterium]
MTIDTPFLQAALASVLVFAASASAASGFDPDGASGRPSSLLAAVADIQAPLAPAGRLVAVEPDAQALAVEISAVLDLAQLFLADQSISEKEWRHIARGVAAGDTDFVLWPGSLHLRRRWIKHYSIVSLKGSSFEVRVEDKKILVHLPSQTRMSAEQMLQALRLALSRRGL